MASTEEGRPEKQRLNCSSYYNMITHLYIYRQEETVQKFRPNVFIAIQVSHTITHKRSVKFESVSPDSQY